MKTYQHRAAQIAAYEKAARLWGRKAERMTAAAEGACASWERGLFRNTETGETTECNLADAPDGNEWRQIL